MTTDGSADDAFAYVVVTNAEEQFSIWPAHREVPAGWTAHDFRGSKSACLEHIDAVWTDMRPLSLRDAGTGAAAG